VVVYILIYKNEKALWELNREFQEAYFNIH